MLKNASLLAIVAVHTAENEASEVGLRSLLSTRGTELAERQWKGAERECQTSGGSFSAVSTATIARKDAFFCIFHNLQDLHPFAPF